MLILSFDSDLKLDSSQLYKNHMLILSFDSDLKLGGSKLQFKDVALATDVQLVVFEVEQFYFVSMWTEAKELAWSRILKKRSQQINQSKKTKE